MPSTLPEVLREARALGFLGPGPVASQLEHAAGLARTASAALGEPPARCGDLGSGGGVPGLVLATVWPRAEVVLLEAAARRCAFLRQAVDALGLGDRVAVAEGRAEELARDPRLEATFPLVVARSFGRPAVAAEGARRLLVDGGCLLVAEPPPDAPAADRWPEQGLAELGFARRDTFAEPTAVLLEAVGPCPARYPRRVGIPAKRPLF